MSHATCCHCLTTAPLLDNAQSGALPTGWRKFTTSDGATFMLCQPCRLKMTEDLIADTLRRVAALEIAMVAVRDIMRTDVPERLPYKTAGKGVVQ